MRSELDQTATVSVSALPVQDVQSLAAAKWDRQIKPERERTKEVLMGMKIVVIGGTGLIGSKVVEKLTAPGHAAVAAAPNTGVNTLDW